MPPPSQPRLANYAKVVLAALLLEAAGLVFFVSFSLPLQGGASTAIALVLILPALVFNAALLLLALVVYSVKSAAYDRDARRYVQQYGPIPDAAAAPFRFENGEIAVVLVALALEACVIFYSTPRARPRQKPAETQPGSPFPQAAGASAAPAPLPPNGGGARRLDADSAHPDAVSSELASGFLAPPADALPTRYSVIASYYAERYEIRFQDPRDRRSYVLVAEDARPGKGANCLTATTARLIGADSRKSPARRQVSDLSYFSIDGNQGATYTYGSPLAAPDKNKFKFLNLVFKDEDKCLTIAYSNPPDGLQEADLVAMLKTFVRKP